MLYTIDDTPTDLNFTLRGLVVVFAVLVLGILAVSNPTPWSPMGHAQQNEQTEHRPSTPDYTDRSDERQA